jgi:hypothetical protein
MMLRILAILTLFALETRAQFVNSKLKQVRHRFQTVLVFPAQIGISKAGFRGSSSMPDKADEIGEGLSAVVRTYLSGKGVKVLASFPSSDGSDGQRYALAEMQRRFDTVDVQMLKNPKGVRRGRFTLSDTVTAYSPAASADSLVFIRGAGSVLDRAERTMGRVPGPWMWAAKDQRFDGRIAFVDARSGEVLLLLAFTTYGHGWKQTAEELMPRIQDSTSQMPIPIYDLLGAPSSGK